MVKKRNNLLLTFDYELFLGDRSGTVENCLITPTEELLIVLSNHQAKSIFFIDTLYLYSLKQAGINYPKAREDYKRITQQLLHIAEEKHYIFYHLHPHWLDSIYLPEINQWNLKDDRHYAVSSLSEEDYTRAFRISKDVMEEIFANKNLSHNGFRAGGLYIQPFNFFKKFFETSNIRFDFSVLPGFRSNQKYYSLDFSEINTQHPYHFNENVTDRTLTGKFLEFPISSITISGLRKIINSMVLRLSSRMERSTIRWGDGMSSSTRLLPKRKNTWWRTTETVSVEMMSDLKIKPYLEALKQRPFLHMISHPKLFTPRHLKCFNRFLTAAKIKFDLEFDLMNIKKEFAG
jgi:hypothetical protein